MVHIIPGSARLVVPQRPVVGPPVVVMQEGFPVAIFRTQQKIIIGGDVGFGAEGGDSTDGWMVGLIQAAWWVEDWAYYRGERHTDGSVLVRQDVPPARPQRACRDCEDNTSVSNIFSDTVAAQKRLESLSKRPRVVLIDAPSSFCWTTTLNALTGKINYLSEAAKEFQFCTVLSVQDPKRVFRHLLHVYWGVRWHATFHPMRLSESSADFRVEVAPTRGQEAWVSRVLDGAPTRAAPLGAKFADVLTSPQQQSCNQMQRAAGEKADSSREGPNRQQSATWQMLLPSRHGPRGSPPHVPLG